MRSVALLFFLLLPLSLPAKPLETLITSQPTGESQIVWPVAAPLPPPGGLRPCCAFGYNLKAQAWGIPVPFYQLGNLVDADRLGTHHYNDSAFNAISNLLGIGSEQLGLIYTHRGGFIDIAHVRDTADNTLFLFSQLLPRLGQQWHIDLSPELATRRIQLNAFSPPQDAAQRYTLAAYLAGEIAFQMAAWHEIAQWYGYRSVPGFSEEVSAFSPEDLYSNLLGHGWRSMQFCKGRRFLSLPTTAPWRGCSPRLCTSLARYPSRRPSGSLTVLTATGGTAIAGCRRNFWC
jgi:hypothetical protein